MKLVRVLLIAAFAVGVVTGCSAGKTAQWYKGNLHTHSLWSDGDDFPERIALWYRDRGYHFLAISDHNTVQEGEKWVHNVELHRRGAGPAAEAYLRDFAGRAKVRGDVAGGTHEIRLAPFEEYKPLVERPGSFLLIRSEEISDKFEKKPIHMNATNLVERIPPQGGNSVVEVIANNLRAVREQGRRLNRPILPHLNHPNFGWGVTAEELAEVVEEPFFEVYNGHPSVNQQGDAQHPSIDRLWDIANTLRIVKFNAPPLMGLATDDSHHYHAPGMNRATSGRGWVMVRSEALTAESLIAAMERGDFYASSGVTLGDVKYDERSRTLEVEVEPDGEARFTTRFIGTMEGSDEVGAVLAMVKGRRATYRLTGRELYVRAVVSSDRPPANPSFAGQVAQAWTQPVGWERRVGR
jgi:hypothetical protein